MNIYNEEYEQYTKSQEQKTLLNDLSKLDVG
jgi:hypothetical protein